MTSPAGPLLAGRYELRHSLGRGAFGHTLLAYDHTAGRAVAVKRLDPRGGEVDLKTVELFEREAAVLRALRHHGVPEVFDVVHEGGASYLVMEFVDGVSLERLIDERRPLDPAEVLHLFLEMLGVLEYLHGRVPPVIHRDVKPSNVVVRPDGRPALVDFGSVRHIFRAPGEAGSTIAGTYGYMPYEQYMGQATPASDLYALAATFLHLLTGRPPRDFMSGEGRIDVPDPLPGDPRLGPVLARLLRPSPAERYASAADVRRALLSPAATPSTMAIQHATAVPSRAPTRVRHPAVALPPAPRPITGDTQRLLDHLAPSALELLHSDAKPGDVAGLSDWVWVAFFSALTLGVLPVVFVTLARARRRRLRRFLQEGSPATARIVSITDDKLEFDAKIAAVAYEFDVDGMTHRDVDKILPVVARRWQPGDEIQVLYLPHVDYDSVIVSG